MKPEVVETETVETANDVVEMTLETATTETSLPDQLTGVEIVCNDCDDLDIDELKEVIEYCSNRIDELQKEEAKQAKQAGM